MKIIPLYRYLREDDGYSTSPIKPQGEYTELFRLIAEENKELTNGNIYTSCIDVDSPDGWIEVEAEKTKKESFPSLL